MGERSCHPCDEPIVDPREPRCPIQCGSLRCKGYYKNLIDNSVKPVVWLLGGPGVGKRTQSKKITERYGFVRITVGSVIREEVANRYSSKKYMITEIINRDGLLPNELVMTLLQEKVLSIRDEATGLLMDGFPRETEQGLLFIRNIAPPSVILYLEAPEETLLQRLAYRAMHPDSSHRITTSEDISRDRINTFFEHVNQILALHQDKIFKINGANSPEQVFIDIARVLDPIMTEAEIQIETRRICKKK